MVVGGFEKKQNWDTSVAFFNKPRGSCFRRQQKLLVGKGQPASFFQPLAFFPAGCRTPWGSFKKDTLVPTLVFFALKADDDDDPGRVFGDPRGRVCRSSLPAPTRSSELCTFLPKSGPWVAPRALRRPYHPHVGSKGRWVVEGGWGPAGPHPPLPWGGGSHSLTPLSPPTGLHATKLRWPISRMSAHPHFCR